MRLIILDRDGVINHDSDAYIKSAAEWQAIEGSLAAIAALSQAAYSVVVASNQSGLGRGLFSQHALNAIHAKMQQQVQAAGGQITRIFYCPHAPDAACACRKPKSGLFEQIAAYFGADLSQTWAIGDSLRDLQAAQAVNAAPVLVRTGKGEATAQILQQLPTAHPLKNTPIYNDLAQVVQQLVLSNK